MDSISFLIPVGPHDAVVVAVAGDMAEVGVQLPIETGVGGEVKLGSVGRERDRVRPGVGSRVISEDAGRFPAHLKHHHEVEEWVVLVVCAIGTHGLGAVPLGFQVAPGIALDVVGHEALPLRTVTVVSVDSIPLGVVTAGAVVALGRWAFRLEASPFALGRVEGRHAISTHDEELFLGWEIVKLGE